MEKEGLEQLKKQVEEFKEDGKKARLNHLAYIANQIKKTQHKYKRPFTKENIKEQHKKRMNLIKSKKLKVVFRLAPITKEDYIKQEKERFNNKLKDIQDG